jgi:hypothetical protein
VGEAKAGECRVGSDSPTLSPIAKHLLKAHHPRHPERGLLTSPPRSARKSPSPRAASSSAASSWPKARLSRCPRGSASRSRAARANAPTTSSFVFHDKTLKEGEGDIEKTLTLDEFPTPAQLWEKYRAFKGLDPEEERIVLQDYHPDAPDKQPRYYQQSAINATVEAIAKGQDRNLLVMATGTGKTYTARPSLRGGSRRRPTKQPPPTATNFAGSYFDAAW